MFLKFWELTAAFIFPLILASGAKAQQRNNFATTDVGENNTIADEVEASRLFGHILNPSRQTLHVDDRSIILVPADSVCLSIFSKVPLSKDRLDEKFWTVIDKSKTDGIMPEASMRNWNNPDGAIEYLYTLNAPRKALLSVVELLKAANSGNSPMITNNYFGGGATSSIQFSRLIVSAFKTALNNPTYKETLEALIKNEGYRVTERHLGLTRDPDEWWFLIPSDGIISRSYPDPFRLLQLLEAQANIVSCGTIDGESSGITNSIGVSN